jgi:DNA-binding response OmpR family regulator
MNKTALVSTANLLFASKLSLMLRELGINSVKLHADSDLPELLRKNEPVIVIFDLGQEPSVCFRRIEELRNLSVGYVGPILCFGPHIATDTMAAAEEAGADLVVANSVISVRGAKIINKLLLSAG